MKALYKKEVGSYLKNPLGYIIIVLFAVFANFMFMRDLFAEASASMQPFFLLLPWLFLVFIPAIAMRALAEEKRTNTIESLLTLPISELQIVVAKFLALLTLVAIALGLTLSLPVTLSFMSTLYLPEILVAYVGSFLLAGLFISITLFFSSQTKNQVIAFLFSIITLFFLVVMDTDLVTTFLPRGVIDAVSMLSPMYHFDPLLRGVLDLRSLFYFVSFTILFLVLTIVDLEKRD